MSDSETTPNTTDDSKGRRKFLKDCAKYASVTAPTMMLLLSPEKGLAGSPGAHGKHHGGDHDHDGKKRKRRRRKYRTVQQREPREWRRGRRRRDKNDDDD